MTTLTPFETPETPTHRIEGIDDRAEPPLNISMLLPSCLVLTWALHSVALSRRQTGCPILFDGQIPSSFAPGDFDTNSSPYSTDFVHGENQTWADIIKLPTVTPSLFDTVVGTQPFEVTLSDESIFVPGGSEPQLGFRRSELIPAINDGTDVTVQGTTTAHWSLQSSSTRSFNLSHEYQIVFHETNDFSTNQFMLKTGAPFGETFVESEHKTLRLEGRQTTQELLFSTPFDDDVWHNFAVTINWSTNDITVFYSKGSDPLTVANVTTNDNSGQGQQHFGILKLPTGDSSIDVVHEGFQESGVDEGLIYGGIFIEDSSDGCVTLF